MRKLMAVVFAAFAAFGVGQAYAADLPEYPIELPPVDYELGGSFYLRGSAALNILWATDVEYGCLCATITDLGYGYSFGAGFGYEFGNGVRTDFTLDHLQNVGLTVDNTYTLSLRSTLGLANVYYDFNFGAGGGFGAYVGAGLGAAYNYASVSGGCVCVDGSSVEAAGALMAGLTYDMGAVVADLGYRYIYMSKITNSAPTPFYVNNTSIHELRGSVRYRFN